ncbi:MAG TPA: hypothetical protein VNO35_18370 [Steroidobacteraceae bacterium]|nr:hypothetical protein [Steroidobacteraceae bacterium]
MQAWGATVVEVGKDFEEARRVASKVAAEEGLHLVPSFHRDLVAGVASEDEIAEAMRIYFDDTHQIAEGAAAAPLAASLKERAQRANCNVGLILSGGNIERARLSQVLNGNTPAAA